MHFILQKRILFYIFYIFFIMHFLYCLQKNMHGQNRSVGDIVKILKKNVEVT